MRQITKIISESTDLYLEFQSVKRIEIGDKIGGGNFGDVFECLSVNGLPTDQPQVIKIFRNQNGIAEPGLKTIKNLQKNLGDYHKRISQSGIGLLERFPAFLGCPQFSFRGELDGEEIIGYSANNLTKLGFVEFNKVLDDPDAFGYDALPMLQRYLIAWHLAAAFDVLRQCFYIHADLKAEAVFIDLKNYRCALIDYDSGAVIQKKDDKPNTIGTPQEWWAPEIINQSNRSNIVRVDIYSDIWSLNMGIHSILFGYFPLIFFKEVSTNVMNEYLKSYQFPQMDLNEPYMRLEPELQQLYPWYVKTLRNDVTPEIVKKIKTNIQQGFFHPTQRVTASQWKTVLQVTQPLPEIKFFRPDRDFVADSRPVRFEWEVEHASIILVNGVIVSGVSYIEIAIQKDQVVELQAISPFGHEKTKRLITVSKEKPTLEYFDCERALRIDHRPSKLRWKVTNAALVEIDQGIGSISDEGEHDVMPRRETTYTLKAVTLFGMGAFQIVA